MTPRLAAGVLVSALVRRVNAEGGHAMVLARGDAESGAVLLICADRGRFRQVIERALDREGIYRWIAVGPNESADPQALTDYLEKRRRNDPDLWLVELDIPEAERLAAEMIL